MKENKKSIVKQQLFAAISMMIIAVVALTGATYAWFTYVSSPEVKDIDLSVKAADELYISAYRNAKMDPIVGDTEYKGQTIRGEENNDPYFDPSLWTATITQDMLKGVDVGPGAPLLHTEAQQSAGFPSELKNLSNIWTVANRTFFTRNLNEQGYATGYPAVAQDPSSGYVSIDLWVKSSKTGIVYLSGDTNNWVRALNTIGAAKMIGTDAEIAEKPGTYEAATDAKKAFIRDAVRVGFYTENEGNATSGNARAVIWEPNSKEHLPAGYGGPGGTTAIDTKAITVAYPGDGTTPMGVETDAEGTKVTQLNWDFGTASNYTPDNTKIALFNLEGGHAVKFTIKIWVEGADKDCVNAVAGAFFRTALQFGQSSDTNTIADIKETK